MDEIVGLCRERLDRGEAVDLDALIAEHPDLADILRPRLAAMAMLSTADAWSTATPETVAHYRLLGELGRGAQGAVFLAEDTRLGRKVALKIITPGLMPGAQSFARFRREAEAASRLDHPGICTVYDAAVEQESPWIAMRYVDGRTLHDWLEDARAQAARGAATSGVDLPGGDGQRVPRIVALVEKVARALHAAHEAGVVHRDVKPGNILVARDGEPVVVDFGLAQEDDEGRALTLTGGVVGTPAYMSPEQLTGKSVRLDARSDVYSLGVTLYECLTLRLPFEAATLDGLYRRILSSSADPPRRANPAVARDLEVVVRTAMERDRDRRYATALDFAEDLRRVRTGEPIRARPTPAILRLARAARRNPSASAGVAAAFLLLASGLAVTAYFLDKSRDEQRRTSAALDERTRAMEHARALALCGASALATPADGVRGLLLAREAVRTEPSVAAFNQLRRAIYGSLERAELVGHEGPVVHVDVSRRGDRIVTASDDGTARLWDAKGKALATLRGHAAAVRFAVFSTSGDRIVTASDDKTARVWTADGSSHVVLAGHEGGVLSARFSPDGERVVTASEDGTARVWLLDGTRVATLAGHRKAVVVAAYSPQGDRILTASSDGTARLWDASGTPISVLAGHTAALRDAAFSPDGDRILTCSNDRTARIWNRAGKETAVFAGHVGNLVKAAWSPQGDRVATTSADGTVRVWDLAGMELLPALRQETPGGWDVAFSPAGDWLLQASSRGAQVWDAMGRTVACLRGHPSDVLGAAFLPSGEQVVTASSDGTARIWDVEPGEVLLLHAHSKPTFSAAFSPRGDAMVTASEDGSARVWDLAGRGGVVLRGHTDRVHMALFSPASDLIATASADRTARIWSLDGTPRAILPCGNGGVRSVCFSPRGDLVATAGYDGVARIFDLAGKQIRELDASSLLAAAEFSPDGARVLTASADGIARVWSVAGERLIETPPHGARLSCAAWSPRGDRFVTGSNDGAAQLWTAAGERLAGLRGHESVVRSVQFSPVGSRILTASSDRTARLWDLDGRELATIVVSDAGATSASFSPKGDRIVTASFDGTVRVWVVRNEDLLALADARITREFTDGERATYDEILRPSPAPAGR